MYPIVKHTNRSLRIPALAATLALLACCVHAKRADEASLKTPLNVTIAGTAKPHLHWFQFGRASWYGHALQGMETASGEAYDMNAMTCAHRSLPLGALIRVTNMRNKKSIVVRVNDRGPVPDTRVVDLSFAAAHRLGFAARGTAPVRIDVISMKPSRSEVAQMTYPDMPSH